MASDGSSPGGTSERCHKGAPSVLWAITLALASMVKIRPAATTGSVFRRSLRLSPSPMGALHTSCGWRDRAAFSVRKRGVPWAWGQALLRWAWASFTGVGPRGAAVGMLRTSSRLPTKTGSFSSHPASSRAPAKPINNARFFTFQPSWFAPPVRRFQVLLGQQTPARGLFSRLAARCRPKPQSTVQRGGASLLLFRHLR